MDLCLAVRAPLDRWALVESLGVDPACGTDLDTALARVLHPTGGCEHVLVLVRGDAELAWLRRVRAAAVGAGRSPTIAAVVAHTVDIEQVAAAGADGVVLWDATTGFPGPSALVALRRAGELTVVLPEDSAVPA